MKKYAITLAVNRQSHALLVSQTASLLEILRNDLGLTAAKYGCGLGECGACTVLVDGKAARSCIIPARHLAGHAITTLEGLAADGTPHPVQQAFITAQAAQCGYCLNGMIMTSVALLHQEPDASDSRIRDVLAGNLCRCGTHIEILEAVHLARQRVVVTAQLNHVSIED
ncbi:MAG: (2Fe-2S)-binding protein [Candidatus Symbiobacter sp.]|nr:(2Fe-2S)-binding protein [Candidatus Symbiobacter sp.]